MKNNDKYLLEVYEKVIFTETITDIIEIIQESNIQNKSLLLNYVELYPKQAVKLYSENQSRRGFLGSLAKGAAALAGGMGLVSQAKASEGTGVPGLTVKVDPEYDVSTRPQDAKRSDFTVEEIKNAQRSIMSVKTMLNNKGFLYTDEGKDILKNITDETKKALYYSSSSKVELVEYLKDLRQDAFAHINALETSKASDVYKGISSDPMVIVAKLNDVQDFLSKLPQKRQDLIDSIESAKSMLKSLQK